MPSQDSIGIGVHVETSDAERAIQAFEQLLGKTIDRSKGLDAALASVGGCLLSTSRAAREAGQSLAEFARTSSRGGESLGGLGSLAAAAVPELAALQETLAGAQGVARALLDTAIAGEAHTRALASLGPAYRLVEESTRGVVSAEEAMRVQQRLTQSGLHVTGEQLAVITRRGREWAISNQVELPQALQQLTSALENGSNRALRHFNLHAVEGESRAAALARNVQEMATTMAGSAPATETLGETVSHVSRDVSEFGQNLVSAIAVALRSDPNVRALGYAFNWLREQLGGANHALEAYVQAHNGVPPAQRETEEGAQSLKTHVENLATAASDAARELHAMKAASLSLSAAMQAGEDNVDRINRLIDNGRHAVAQRIEQTLAAAAVARQLRAEFKGHESLVDQILGIHSGGGGHGAQRLQDAQRELGEQVHTAEKVGADLVQIARTRGETLAHYLHREVEAQRVHNVRIAEARRQDWEDAQHVLSEIQRINQERAALDREIADRAADDAKRVRDERRQESLAKAADLENERTQQQTELKLRQSYSAQTVAAFADLARNMHTPAEAIGAIERKAFETGTQALTSHVAALIAGKESMGQALQGILSQTLAAIGAQAQVEALKWGALGISHAAGVLTAGLAPGDFAAAAAWEGVAIAAGVGAALTSGGGSSGGGSGAIAQAASASPASGYGAGSGGSSGGTVINVNVSGTLFTNEGVSNGVVRALNDARQRGLVPHGTG